MGTRQYSHGLAREVALALRCGGGCPKSGTAKGSLAATTMQSYFPCHVGSLSTLPAASPVPLESGFIYLLYDHVRT